MKYILNGRGIAFDGETEKSQGNEFTKNAVIFEADESNTKHPE